MSGLPPAPSTQGLPSLTPSDCSTALKAAYVAAGLQELVSRGELSHVLRCRNCNVAAEFGSVGSKFALLGWLQLPIPPCSAPGLLRREVLQKAAVSLGGGALHTMSQNSVIKEAAHWGPSVMHACPAGAMAPAAGPPGPRSSACLPGYGSV